MIKNLTAPKSFQEVLNVDVGHDVFHALCQVESLATASGYIRLFIHRDRAISDFLGSFNDMVHICLQTPVITRIVEGKPHLFNPQNNQPATIQAISHKLANGVDKKFYPDLDIYLSEMQSATGQALIVMENKYKPELPFRRFLVYTTTASALRLLISGQQWAGFQVANTNIHLCLDGSISKQGVEHIRVAQRPLPLNDKEKIQWSILSSLVNGIERPALYMSLESIEAPEQRVMIARKRRNLVYDKTNQNTCSVILTA